MHISNSNSFLYVSIYCSSFLTIFSSSLAKINWCVLFSHDFACSIFRCKTNVLFSRTLANTQFNVYARGGAVRMLRTRDRKIETGWRWSIEQRKRIMVEANATSNASRGMCIFFLSLYLSLSPEKECWCESSLVRKHSIVVIAVILAGVHLLFFHRALECEFFCPSLFNKYNK